MVEDSQRRSIAVFFYFALQDEKMATQATVKSLQRIRKRLEAQEKAGGVNPHFSEALLVSVTQKIWDKFKHGIRNTQSAVSIEGGWLVPEGTDLGPWREFRKEAKEEEFLILLWSQVLKLSDNGISHGLGISTGTVRYRIGRALRRLGRMVVESE